MLQLLPAFLCPSTMYPFRFLLPKGFEGGFEVQQQVALTISDHVAWQLAAPRELAQHRRWCQGNIKAANEVYIEDGRIHTREDLATETDVEQRACTPNHNQPLLHDGPPPKARPRPRHPLYGRPGHQV